MLAETKPTKLRSLSNIISLSEFVNPNTLPTKISQTFFQPIQNPQQYQSPFQLGHSVDNVTYTKLVQSSSGSGSVIHGKLAHTHMIKTGFNPCQFLQNTLVNMYFNCGEVEFARKVFDKMPERNVVSWNSLISGYTRSGLYRNALSVFHEARVEELKLDKYTYASILSVCSQMRNLELGKVIHGLIILSGLGSHVFLTNSLVDLYSKCGRIDQAKLVFDNSDELDDVSWNSLIGGYVQSGSNNEMLQLLAKMHRLGMSFSSYVLGSVLKACCSNFSGSIECGKTLHAYAVKQGWDLDVVVGTALLDMYAKIGDLNDASLIFKLLPNKNVVMYNAMIAGLFRTEEISDEYAKKGLNIFSEMQRCGFKLSKFTFSTIIKACNAFEGLEYGKQIHALICKNNLQSDEFIGSVLVEFYSSLGSIKDGIKCFNSTNKQDIVTWTSMIVGHAQNGQFENALALFIELLSSRTKPDEFVVSIVLSVCANLAAARTGEQIQGYAIKNATHDFIVVRNSLMYMYAKCGDIDSANLIFEATKNRDRISWSAIICCTAHHGCAKEALKLFELMKEDEIKPNHITFLGVLTACSHGGLVDEGFKYFESMKKDHNMTPNEKHCACVVDLLGRAGRLVDAERFIADSGFADVAVMWRALLGACRIHKDTVTGARVSKRVIELEPEASASYVLLYNIYTEARLETEATRIRELITERGIKKEPGLSWLEVGSMVHSFLAGDRSHPMSEKVYEKLEEMLEKIRKIGYFCDNERVVLDGYHSEKLAVTYGIISLPSLAPVRVMKNLRVCRDCHTTMKFFSKVEKREIVLRDAIRFHRFRDGSCSCGDYW